MQDFKRVLDLNCKKRRIAQFNFFNWLSNVKNLVLENGSEYVRNVTLYGIKIAFFSQELRKIAQRLGASPPDPIASGGRGPRPQTPHL